MYVLQKTVQDTEWLKMKMLHIMLGILKFGNLGNPNMVSLGIELINWGIPIPVDEFPLTQIKSCAEQVAIWMKKYNSICNDYFHMQELIHKVKQTHTIFHGIYFGNILQVI
jgi:hypothetical protein